MVATGRTGTSVGSGAVPLRYAVIVGGLMDWLGAVTLGAGARFPLNSRVRCAHPPLAAPIARPASRHHMSTYQSTDGHVHMLCLHCQVQ
jgi:hypothetical protein